MMKYKKPEYLAGSTSATPQNCGMVTPVTITKVAPRHERSCIYNPQRRTLEQIESDISEVEAQIAKGIDIGPEWNRIMNRYNSLQVEFNNVSAANNEALDKKKYLAKQREKTRLYTKKGRSI